jgi:hypothetical protein
MKGNPRSIPNSVIFRPPRKQKVEPLSPFFLTDRVRRTIERLLPSGYHRRMSMYFETYGCIGCKRKDVMYVCNGLCKLCLKRIYKRLWKIDKKLESECRFLKDNRDDAYLVRFRSARELLADLLPKCRKRVSEKSLVGRPAPRIYLS